MLMLAAVQFHRSINYYSFLFLFLTALQQIFQDIVVLDLSHQSLSQVAVHAVMKALANQQSRIAHLQLESCDLRTDSLDQLFLTAKCE